MRVSFWILPFALLSSGLFAQDPAKQEKKITFEEHIKPIFREHCTVCHSESDKESDLALDTYGATLAGGSSGPAVKEGDADGSRLYALVTHAERPFMPPDEDAMAKEKLDLIKTWISQGMPENSGSKIKRFNSAAAAMLTGGGIGKPDGPPPMPESVLKQTVTETARSSAISAIAASPWAPLIAVGGQLQVSLYHAASGELLGVIPFPEGEAQSLTFTRDGKQLLIGGGQHSHSGCAVLVDIATGKRITKVGDELDIVMAADITSDKKRIAIAGPQKIVRIFDSISGQKVFELKKHTDWIFALRYSPDGVLLASGDRSNGLIVWEADTGNLYSQLNGHRGEIRSVDFRADSNVLASASLDGTVKLWDMFESKQIKSWNAHGGGTTAVCYTNNGMLATAGKDTRVKLWDGNGGLKGDFKGLGAPALEVAITGDAAYLAGGDWNGAVSFWAAADPAKHRFVAANPPSIETRLQKANAKLTQVKAEFAGVQQTAQQASQAAQAAATQLTNAQDNSKSLSDQLGKAQATQKDLQNKVGTMDAQIKQLEAQLTALKTDRQKAGQSLVQTVASVKDLTQKSTAAKAAIAAATKANEEKAKVAADAAELLKAAQAKLAAAEAAAQTAAKEKADLDALATNLRKAAKDTASKSTTLETQVAAAVNAQATQESTTTNATQKLAALQAEMEALKQRIAAADKLRNDAETNLKTKRQAAAELQQQLDAAQQAALDAKEQLELFEKSYKN